MSFACFRSFGESRLARIPPAGAGMRARMHSRCLPFVACRLMDGRGAIKALRCECGHVVEGRGEAFVAAVQDHARAAHGMELPAGLVLAVASPRRPHTEESR